MEDIKLKLTCYNCGKILKEKEKDSGYPEGRYFKWCDKCKSHRNSEINGENYVINKR